MKSRTVLLGLLASTLAVGAAQAADDVAEKETTSASGPKIETGFAEVNGTRLYYEVGGTGDPIVLIHGNFGDRRYYDGQFEALARLHRVLRYDVRGYGKSMLPEEGVPYSDFEDLEALMAHLDIASHPVAHRTTATSSRPRQPLRSASGRSTPLVARPVRKRDASAL